MEPLTAGSPAAGELHELDLRGLHCGSGAGFFPGCLNTDALELRDEAGNATEPGRVYRVGANHFYLQHDATRRFPLERGTFDWIYSEHFIEHLSPEHGIKFLRQSRRLLRDGGVNRISTPDLGKYMAGYMDPEQAFFKEHHRRISGLRGVQRRGAPERPAWMVNQCFYMWGHKWIYDFDELRHAAEAAGFGPAACVRRRFREGLLPEVSALDQEWRSHESLYVEIVNE